MEIVNQIQSIISNKNYSYQTKISFLRRILLSSNIPVQSFSSSKTNKITLRGKLWFLLTRFKIDYEASNYNELVENGKNIITQKQSLDVSGERERTKQLSKSEEQKINHEEMITRLIYAHTSFSTIEYSQRMSIIMSICLELMNEIDAFYFSEHIFEHFIPQYWKSFKTCENASKLVIECLYFCDNSLYQTIHQRKQLLSFADALAKHIASFGTESVSFSEAILLFDYYIAKGFHSVIYIVLSQLIGYRDTILESDKNPSTLIMKMNKTHAKQLFILADVFENCLPEKLKELIKKHVTEDISYHYES